MAIRAKKQNPWFVILIIAAAVILWALDQRKVADAPPPRKTEQREKSAPPPSSTPAAPEKAPSSSRTGKYETYRGCTLAEDRTNDGDSFRVHLPDGRKEIFRLYFVDAPESAFKTYGNGEDNHDRIRDQARDMHVTPEEAVEIGRRAKSFVLQLLGSKPFTLHTVWDSPYNDRRYHAFIEVESGGKKRWLHELLIEKRLARIKTKPADLPDGTPASEQRRKLEAMLR